MNQRGPWEPLRDAFYSLGPIGVKAAVWTWVRHLHRNGYGRLYTAPIDSLPHLLYVLACIVALDYLHDAWFYWTHRLLHWRPLYKHVHYIHHKYVHHSSHSPPYPASGPINIIHVCPLLSAPQVQGPHGVHGLLLPPAGGGARLRQRGARVLCLPHPHGAAQASTADRWQGIWERKWCIVDLYLTLPSPLTPFSLCPKVLSFVYDGHPQWRARGVRDRPLHPLPGTALRTDHAWPHLRARAQHRAAPRHAPPVPDKTLFTLLHALGPVRRN